MITERVLFNLLLGIPLWVFLYQVKILNCRIRLPVSISRVYYSWYPSWCKLCIVNLGLPVCTESFLWQIDSGLFLISFCPTLLENLDIFQDEKRLRGALWFANGCGALTVKERGAIPALPTKEDVFAAILGSGKTF